MLLVDALKGFVAAYFLPQWLVAQGAIAPEHELYYRLACGALAVVGHIYPVFAQFRGGKGVATILGMMLGVAPATVGVCMLVFIVMLLLFRYVSPGQHDGRRHLRAAAAAARSSGRRSRSGVRGLRAGGAAHLHPPGQHRPAAGGHREPGAAVWAK